MKNILLIIPFSLFFFLSSISTYCLLVAPQAPAVLGSQQTAKKGLVWVSAFVGGCRFTLWGYTSPHALVSLQGMGIYDETYARDDGYFEFNNRFSPLSPKEVCLTSRDQFGRLTVPTCLPPFPTQTDVNIGPVILPPTISFDKSNYYMGDQIITTGQSLPNSNLDFSIFVDEKKSFVNYLAFVKPVEALTFPELQTKTDKHGNFSLVLPSNNPQFFRIFAQSQYKTSMSPKSNTLNIIVLPWWMMIINFLKSHLPQLLIVCLISGLLYYIYNKYFRPYEIAKRRAIVKLYSPLLKEETDILTKDL